jgi:hypothetical protein
MQNQDSLVFQFWVTRGWEKTQWAGALKVPPLLLYPLVTSILFPRIPARTRAYTMYPPTRDVFFQAPLHSIDMDPAEYISILHYSRSTTYRIRIERKIRTTNVRFRWRSYLVSESARLKLQINYLHLLIFTISIFSILPTQILDSLERPDIQTNSILKWRWIKFWRWNKFYSSFNPLDSRCRFNNWHAPICIMSPAFPFRFPTNEKKHEDILDPIS